MLSFNKFWGVFIQFFVAFNNKGIKLRTWSSSFCLRVHKLLHSHACKYTTLLIFPHWLTFPWKVTLFEPIPVSDWPVCWVGGARCSGSFLLQLFLFSLFFFLLEIHDEDHAGEHHRDHRAPAGGPRWRPAAEELWPEEGERNFMEFCGGESSPGVFEVEIQIFGQVCFSLICSGQNLTNIQKLRFKYYDSCFNICLFIFIKVSVMCRCKETDPVVVLLCSTHSLLIFIRSTLLLLTLLLIKFIFRGLRSFSNHVTLNHFKIYRINCWKKNKLNISTLLFSLNYQECMNMQIRTAPCSIYWSTHWAVCQFAY